ncbi:MAG: HemK2/MTQ2 family protein methyltransferase [Thermoplasmatota archaeon]
MGRRASGNEGGSARPALEVEGLRLSLGPDVYEPADDSFLMLRVLRSWPLVGRRVLELGSGTGILSTFMARQGAHVLSVDRNPLAAALTDANARENQVVVRPVIADGAAALCGRFDLVVSNPPYLPDAGPETEPALDSPLEHAFSGGPTGAEVSVRWIGDLSRLLSPGGEALWLTSTRGNEEAILAAARSNGFAATQVATEGFFFERLTVWALRRPASDVYSI